jgi:antitoxin component of MazEF toxin-antitoxin module
MSTEVIVKKWGNSVGVILPKDLVDTKHLKENDKIMIEVIKEGDLSDIFDSLPRKMSGQEFKDMVRKGWR